jgi:hypothetical protein
MQTPSQLDLLAYQLADAWVIDDIESNAHGERDADGQRWYDVRPMLDPREQPPQLIDMARLELEYASQRGLTVAHPHRGYLLRIVRGTAADAAGPGR